MNEVVFFSQIQKAVTLISAADEYFGILLCQEREEVHKA